MKFNISENEYIQILNLQKWHTWISEDECFPHDQSGEMRRDRKEHLSHLFSLTNAYVIKYEKLTSAYLIKLSCSYPISNINHKLFMQENMKRFIIDHNQRRRNLWTSQDKIRLYTAMKEKWFIFKFAPFWGYLRGKTGC